MKKHTDARLQDAIVDHLSVQGGYGALKGPKSSSSAATALLP